MPTKHQRTFVTHTPQVVRALEVARRRWPEEERESALLVHLVEEGMKAVESGDDAERAERVARLRALARHSDFYGEGYLEEVREGWPE